MSGTWMKLHDVHVRLDRFAQNVWDVTEVSRALSNLYDVPGKGFECDECSVSDEYCECDYHRWREQWPQFS